MVSFAPPENPFVFSVNLGAGQMSMPKKSFFADLSDACLPLVFAQLCLVKKMVK
jgi:hypothetical protein